VRCRDSCPDGTWTGPVRDRQRVVGSPDGCSGSFAPNESSPWDVDFLEMLFEVFHRLKDEIHAKVRGQFVWHVLHTRQIAALAEGGGEVGDIGHEHLPGLALPELVVQSVRYDDVLVRRPTELSIRVHPPNFGDDVIFSHQSANPFMVDWETKGSEHLHVQPPITNFAFVTIMGFLEECRI